MRKITWFRALACALVVAGEMILLGFYLIKEAVNEVIRR